MQCVDAAAAVGGGEDDVWVDGELLAEAKLQSDYEREWGVGKSVLLLPVPVLYDGVRAVYDCAVEVEQQAIKDMLLARCRE